MIRESRQINFSRTALMLAIAMSMLIMVVMVIGASAAPTASDMSESTKSADKAEAEIGETVKYTLLIKNSGDMTADDVTVVDTLPANLTYVAGSLNIPAANGVIPTSQNATAQEISWEGDIAFGAELVIEYEAEVGAAATLGGHLTNTVEIDDNVAVVTKMAATKVVSDTGTEIYLPYVTKAFLAPTMGSAPRATKSGDDFTWTITWQDNNTFANKQFELQEANDADFTKNVRTYTGSTNSRSITHAPSWDNVYYYRVRITNSAGSPWSDVIEVVNAYRDDFDDPASGWEMRRQDFDDTQNELTYENGALKMWTRGRWDYFMASPLKPAPEPPYRLTFWLEWSSPGHENVYGVVYGGDWNGGECPSVFAPENRSPEALLQPEGDPMNPTGPFNARANVVDNCMNHYYRVWNQWFNGNNVKLKVKQIDFHDENNEGRNDPSSVELAKNEDADTLPGTANEGHAWTLEVYPDGRHILWAGSKYNRNGGINENAEMKKYMDTINTDYIDYPYFGFLSATGEYIGSDPLFDWILVEPLDP